MCAQVFPDLLLKLYHCLGLQNRSLAKNSTSEIRLSLYLRLRHQIILFKVKVKNNVCVPYNSLRAVMASCTTSVVTLAG